MILYRPVSLHEMELIYDGGMKSFPARLPQQPIFYPVLDLEYARQIASEWNVKNGQFAGYVTQFKVDDQYIDQFEKHTVGESQHQEFWIPEDELDEFNRHITGLIKVVEAHFGDGFQGFVPDKFGLQGKKAAEQFTLLANSYIYKRIDFYLEIKRNHKAVFLNYPFWQKHEFKNQGLKGKVLQAIKEAWFTSFPKIPLPLPLPVQEDSPLVKQKAPHSPTDAVDEDVTPVEETESYTVDPADEEDSIITQTAPDPLEHTDDDDTTAVDQIDAHAWIAPVREPVTPVKQTDFHFSQGVEFGLSGRYQEAVDELSKAVEEDPDHVVAHISLGVAFHRLGEDDRALVSYEAALRLDPIYAESHYFRSNILYSHGNVREAIVGYTIALGLKPDLIEAHLRPVPQDRLTDYTHTPAEMSWIARPAHRILDLNESLETHPGQAYLFKERAAEYYRLRNYVQAIADYGSYLAIQPNDASVLHFRGLAYEQIGQLNRALEDYQRAIAINPQLSHVYVNRGVAFGRMGNLRQSIASFTESIRLTPQNPDGYFNRGTAYLQQGDFERAIDDFSDVIRLSPKDDAAYYWRGISNEEAGRQREAIADYKQFLLLTQDANARKAIEQKLSQLSVSKPESASNPHTVVENRQSTDQNQPEQPRHELDLYDLLLALGERAIHSTWFGSGVGCYGERAEDLYALTDQNKPIEGHDLLPILTGIRQTIEGDFQAFDPGATSPWIFLRAWNGNGFYIETNDPKIKKLLQTRFPGVDEVEGASAPYESLFIELGQAPQ
jgi:tetratricopeptide (TPR) repeat protein